MAAGGRTDPYPDFRYAVELVSPDGEPAEVGGFSEVDGVEVEIETETYREGGVNDRAHVLPTGTSHGTVTLRRGLTEEATLWEWTMDATRGRAERKLVRVVVQDARGAEAVGWELHRALPVRWSGPDLAADGGRVAVEELAFAYERIGPHGGSR